MAARSSGILLLFLCFPLMDATLPMIETAEWLAVSSDLNKILDVIASDPTLTASAEESYSSNSGSVSYQNFADRYRKNCGNPMEAYAR